MDLWAPKKKGGGGWHNSVQNPLHVNDKITVAAPVSLRMPGDKNDPWVTDYSILTARARTISHTHTHSDASPFNHATLPIHFDA